MDQDTPLPSPRYAHQFVYDTARNVHYMFGGNPGRTKSGDMRLDDLWKLSVSVPSLQLVCHVMVT